MYHPTIITASIDRLAQRFMKRPDGKWDSPVEHSIPEVDSMVAQLKDSMVADKKTGEITLTRALTPDEERFIINEKVMTKASFPYWAERYAFCSKEGAGFVRMYPLLQSQHLINREYARLELQRLEADDKEGLLALILKARRLGASTYSVANGVHRLTTQAHVDGLLAADVPEQTSFNFGIFKRMFDKLPLWLRPQVTSWAFSIPEKYEFGTGSTIVARSGKSLRGNEQERGDMGRGRGFGFVHLTELAKWEAPDQIDSALEPTMAYDRRVFVVYESSPRGRGNWWHKRWLHAQAGKGRFTPIFIPWYAGEEKYLRRPPEGWVPKDTTLAHARRCEEQGPKWLHRAVKLTKEQLYWYEFTRDDYEGKDSLSDFLQEYAADPDECFVFSAKGLIPLTAQQRQVDHARPLLGCFEVLPAATGR